MPNLESHLDTVGGARYITVCDVQKANHQIPVAESEQDKNCFCDAEREVGFQTPTLRYS